MGALTSVYVGYAVTWIPGPLHLLAAMVAGILGGAFWGFIPGVLRARTGAHEVIVTIMLNYVAIQITSFLLSGPMKDPSPAIAVAQTPRILPSAHLPLIVTGFRVHWGVAARAPRRRRLLVADQQDHHRLPDPHRRQQRLRRPLRRHRRRRAPSSSP